MRSNTDKPASFTAIASPSSTQECTGRPARASTTSGERSAKSKPLRGDQAHTVAFAMDDDAKTVVLDFVNPAGPRGRLLGGTGQARFEAPDRALKLTQR